MRSLAGVKSVWILQEGESRMGLFGKKKEVRNLTKEEAAEIKEEMARQMLSKKRK